MMDLMTGVIPTQPQPTQDFCRPTQVFQSNPPVRSRSHNIMMAVAYLRPWHDLKVSFLHECPSFALENRAAKLSCDCMNGISREKRAFILPDPIERQPQIHQGNDPTWMRIIG